MRFLFYMLHKPIVLSLDPYAKYFTSIENTTLYTELECPVKVFMHSPLDTFHKPIILSPDPDTKYFPSPENTTLDTWSECSVRILMHSPFDTIHNPIVLFVDPKATISWKCYAEYIIKMASKGFDSFSARSLHNTIV